MLEGKEGYDNIPVPKELDGVYAEAVLRAKRQKKKRLAGRYGLAAAACLSVFLLCNNDVVYASASQIPVIGTFVQMLHVGEGGTVTDGARGELKAKENRLDITLLSDEITGMPHYQLQYDTMPRRVTVTLSGVRGFDKENLAALAKECEGIKDLYFLTILDDSQYQFVVELEEGYGYEAKEYKDPGMLQLQFTKDASQQEEVRWVVRVPSMENGEPLAMISELFNGQAQEYKQGQKDQGQKAQDQDQKDQGQKAQDQDQKDQGQNEQELVPGSKLQTVKTQAGLFTVMAGPYLTREEAEQAVKDLNQSGISESDWYLEELAASQRPQ